MLCTLSFLEVARGISYHVEGFISPHSTTKKIQGLYTGNVE
jgi:primosomal replication protein N